MNESDLKKLLIDILKNNLTINTKEKGDYYSRWVEIQLIFDNTVISEATINLD